MTVPTNPNAVFNTIGQIGINFNRRTNATTETNPIEFALGTTVVDAGGKIWVYVRAPAAIASNNSVTITLGTIDAASIATKTLLNYVNGTAAFAALDFGWVQSVRRLGQVPPNATYTGSGN